MNFYHKSTIPSILLLLLFVCSFPGKAQTNVSVSPDETAIYLTPGTNSSHHLIAQKGDVFEIQKVQGDWVQINLFSGAERYIKNSQVEMVNEIPHYPSDPAIRNKLCMSTAKAQSKATKKAMSDYPDNTRLQATYEKILFDEYMLNTFRRFDISASHYSKLVECVNDPLQPINVNIQY